MNATLLSAKTYTLCIRKNTVDYILKTRYENRERTFKKTYLFKNSFCLSFFFDYLPSPNRGLTPPGTYNPNAHGSDVCRGSNSLWTRTLDIYTTAGLHECVISITSGSPPETTQDRTQTKDTHPIPGQKVNFPTMLRRRILFKNKRLNFFIVSFEIRSHLL